MLKTLASVLAGLSLTAAASASVTFGDSAGDVFTGAGGGILDILSVEVTSNATDISFKINVAGDPVATDWGKYMVIIDTVAGNGNGDAMGNGWARPVGYSGVSGGEGAERWLGSWVDSGNGLENYSWNGSNWSLIGATYNATPGLTISKTSTSVTLNVPLADLGVAPGANICFDVFTSGGGGGDGAIDSLGNPGVQVGDWGQYSVAHPVCYTVPAPAAPALLGAAGLLVARRRRR